MGQQVSTTANKTEQDRVLLWRPCAVTMQLYVAFERSRAGLWTGFWDFPEERQARSVGGALTAWKCAAAVGRYPTPGFAPHRGGTTLWTHLRPQAPGAQEPQSHRQDGLQGDGLWLTPAELKAGHLLGTLVLSPMVWPVVQALHDSLCAGADVAEAVAQLVAVAPGAAKAMGLDSDLGVYPLTQNIALVPLRTPTLPPATHTNCYILGDRMLTLVDPGSPYDDQQQALLHLLARHVAQGARIEGIWLSHFHEDHTGAAQRVHETFGAPICAHEDTAMALKGRVTINKMLHEQDELRVGDETFTALHTPGHALGHLCFWAHQGGHLLSGDNVLGTGTPIVPPLPHGSMSAYLQSLSHMAARPLGLLLPGHGPPCPSAATRLQETMQARLAREALLLRTLSASPDGATLQALCHKLYRGLAASLMGLAELSTRAHLEKLCQEHRVRLTGRGAESCYTLAVAANRP